MVPRQTNPGPGFTSIIIRIPNITGLLYCWIKTALNCHRESVFLCSLVCFLASCVWFSLFPGIRKTNKVLVLIQKVMFNFLIIMKFRSLGTLQREMCHWTVSDYSYCTRLDHGEQNVDFTPVDFSSNPTSDQSLAYGMCFQSLPDWVGLIFAHFL